MKWLFSYDFYELKTIVSNSHSKTVSLIFPWFLLSFSTAIILVLVLSPISLHYLPLEEHKIQGFCLSQSTYQSGLLRHVSPTILTLLKA